MSLAGIGRAVAAFVVRTSDKTALAARSQKLQLLVGILNRLQVEPAQQNWQQRCGWLQQATETLSVVNRQQKFTGAAMAFCNEIASRWHCERVCLGFLQGRYVACRAMSRTEKFSRKMKVVQDIEAAMEECVDQDVEITHPAPPQATARAANPIATNAKGTSVSFVFMIASLPNT